MSRSKIYIAYGSNLNLKQMSYRCPTAEVVATSQLKNYQLLFKGSKTGCYATVEQCKGKTVPVLLWKVKKQDELALDRYEGYPNFYDKKHMNVEVNGKKVTAFVYQMTDRNLLGMPSKNYIDTIEEGYKSAGFDVKILEDAIVETYEKMQHETKQEQIDDLNMKWW